jgi:hypothetical protein
MFWARELIPDEKTDRVTVVIAFVIATVTACLLVWEPWDSGVGVGAVPIGVAHMDKKIRVRHSRSLRWVSASRSLTVFKKDMIYTPKDTTVEFQWHGKTLVLEPESLIQFDDIEGDKLEISLLDGKLRSDSHSKDIVQVSKKRTPSLLAFAKKELPALGDLDPLVLRHGELSSRVLECLGRNLTIESTRAVVVPELYLEKLADYRIVPTFPGSKPYQYDQLGWVTFNWMNLPLKNVKFTIEVLAQGSLFSPTRFVSDTNQVKVIFENPGNYEWKIIASQGKEKISMEPRTLTLDSERGVVPVERNFASSVNKKAAPLKSVSEIAGEKSREPDVELASHRNTLKKTPFELLWGAPNKDAKEKRK